MVERLAEPLLAGVYGGEASQLGVRAVLPRFAQMETQYGSLGKAMLAARRKMPAAKSPRPLFTSLRNGMQQLADSLIARLYLSARLIAPVQAMTAERRRLDLYPPGTRPEHFNAVIVGTSAQSAAGRYCKVPI